jgi:hypothetical protein
MQQLIYDEISVDEAAVVATDMINRNAITTAKLAKSKVSDDPVLAKQAREAALCSECLLFAKQPVSEDILKGWYFEVRRARGKCD